jgi:LacI family transcriptional regulator
MKTKVTIKDIAQELGITAATVSRALRDHPEISPGTIRKVKAVAKRLDYRTNKIASSLRSGKTHVIGVVIPTAEHLFFGSVIHGISNLASERGYDVLIYQSNESEQFEKKGVETFIDARVDGILASISKGTTELSHFRTARERNIPVAFFDRTQDDSSFSSVCVDDYSGGFMAAESLITSGYQRIAHISGPQHIKAFSERLRGYQDALRKYGMSPDKQLIYAGDISIESGKAGISHLLALEAPPDALFAVEDFTALGALKELKARSVAVPGSFGIIGFCNDLFGAHISPTLSTVDQKTVQMGEEAFNLLYELIQGNKNTIQRRVLSPELIVRESSAR